MGSNKITREAIHHIAQSNYSYGYDNETLHLRVKTSFFPLKLMNH